MNFYRDWDEYKRGFGSLTGEFGLGLDKIHRLTSSGKYKLRVDLEDFSGNAYYAEYEFFKGAQSRLNGLKSLAKLSKFRRL